VSESGLDFSYNEEQDAIRVAVDRFCTQRNVRDLARQAGAPFLRQLWRDLAALGVFQVAAPDEAASGGALAMCAIAETLGQHLFPGPVAATYIAAQVLEPDTADRVRDGDLLVCLGSVESTLLPWGADADVFLIVDGPDVARAHTPGFVEPVATLGGETWGRAHLKVDESFHPVPNAAIAGNIASAAYLAGAAWHLLQEAAAYAALRKQFGKTLGEFQAVSHALADCAIALSAAQALARAASCAFDSAAAGSGEAQPEAAAAVLSARRASLNTAYTCHQVFGGIGITLEGPAFYISRRIRQLASTPPVGHREHDILLAASGLGA